MKLSAATGKNRLHDLVGLAETASVDDLFVKDGCLWKLRPCRGTFIARQKFSHLIGERREADVCYRSIGSPDSEESIMSHTTYPALLAHHINDDLS